MERKHTQLGAMLESPTIHVVATLTPAGPFALRVRLDEALPPGTAFERVVIALDSSSPVLGPARFMADSPSREGILVFTETAYDCEALFASGEVLDLGILRRRQELVMAMKERVSDEFKQYMADLIYDLGVYKQHLDALDARLDAHDGDARRMAEAAILNDEMPSFSAFLQKRLDTMERTIAAFSREDHEHHGFYLRRQIWDIILLSPFMARTNLRPRGYAGDSAMMQMIYENDFRGETLFAKLLYKFSLEHPASRSVRNRRALVARLIRDHHRTEKPSGEAIRFMSVACGPAFELDDLYSAADDVARFNCVLLDQDHEALDEARATVRSVEERLGTPMSVEYIEGSVRTMLRTADPAGQWGHFDFIYSMGLFDYLTPPTAKAVAEKIYSLLAPGGTMLIGNFHVANPSRWFMEYWHDWVLYYRTEEDMRALTAGTAAVNTSILFEDARAQMFLIARKPR